MIKSLKQENRLETVVALETLFKLRWMKMEFPMKRRRLSYSCNFFTQMVEWIWSNEKTLDMEDLDLDNDPVPSTRSTSPLK